LHSLSSEHALVPAWLVKVVKDSPTMNCENTVVQVPLVDDQTKYIELLSGGFKIAVPCLVAAGSHSHSQHVGGDGEEEEHIALTRIADPFGLTPSVASKKKSGKAVTGSATATANPISALKVKVLDLIGPSAALQHVARPPAESKSNTNKRKIASDDPRAHLLRYSFCLLQFSLHQRVVLRWRWLQSLLQELFALACYVTCRVKCAFRAVCNSQALER
jgi:hypothetical protein